LPVACTGTYTTTSTPNELAWEAVDGGEGRACRGATSSDNSASHYTAYFGVATIEDCKTKCVSTAACTGIEYKPSSRCEVWTREDGIRASKAVAGYICLRYGSLPADTTPEPAGPFEAVDGGEGRACRGSAPSDNRASYYTLYKDVGALVECKAKCQSTASCVGIEYSFGRCEVWTRDSGIQASVPVSGFACFRYGTLPTTTMPVIEGEFEAIDGGEGRACRGANPSDNSASYFTLHVGTPSLQDCQVRCAAATSCVGIEYKTGRCEIWSRPEGIQATAPVAGFKCFRYTRHGSTSSCSKAWATCGGQTWNGPTCCAEGYTCEYESQWHSQCKPKSLLLEPVSCCQAVTAECLACRQGISVHEFCNAPDHSNVHGCEAVLLAQERQAVAVARTKGRRQQRFLGTALLQDQAAVEHLSRLERKLDL